MSSDNLPARVAEAGLLFRNMEFRGDAQALQQIIDWGYAQIDREYPEDPVRAPLNVIRRQRARMEWQRVIRTSGSELRGAVASAAVQELKFQLERRQEAILAGDRERARRAAVEFDRSQRVGEYEEISATELARTISRLEKEHELRERAEDAASRRRIDEQYTAVIADAISKTLAGSSASKIMEATRMVNAEVTRIRRDPNLTPDEQHFQIKTLLETLPHMLRGVRAHDV